MTRFAHTHELAEWHRLDDHLDAVAHRAGELTDKWGAKQYGRALGALHDIGKASEAFHSRLTTGERADHMTAGTRLASSMYGDIGRLIAYGVAGHHGGLINAVDLDARLKQSYPPHDHHSDVAALPSRLPRLSGLANHPDGLARAGFQMHHFGRMLFSALVDADFIDTESYYAAADDKDKSRGSSHSLLALGRRLDEHMQQFAGAEGDVNACRAEVLAACRDACREIGGLFSLTVPTGGGKTLASLVWAINHARTWGLDRVIIVAPYMSIIDQTAEVIRGALGDMADAVLEHHSGADPYEKADLRGAEKLERDAENWDAPIVITTAVQFFESLFSNKPSRCRKLHNIANSVVILDEAQTLPPHLLQPCVAMIDEMARNYHTSICLCTATQPALDHRPDDERSLDGGLIPDDVREIIPRKLKLHERLRRVSIEYAGAMSDADVIAGLAQVNQGLVIVNTRRHALQLFELARDLEGVAHLSAFMCPAHRVQRLDEIRERLRPKAAGKPVRLIATTVVEAGVDVDFEAVWRSISGVDSMNQSAGRCNRHGERDLESSRVVVFDPADPNAIPRHVRIAVNATREVLQHHTDLSSPAAIRHYFRSLYSRRDYADGGLDAGNIMPSLVGAVRGHRYDYADIAEAMRLIDDSGPSIIIPLDDTAQRALAIVRDPRAGFDLRLTHRTLQRYQVQVPQSMADSMIDARHVAPINDRDGAPLELINMAMYRDDVGLVISAAD